MPVRKIPKSYVALTGRIANSKGEAPVAFESSLERDLFVILDFDLNVERYEEQPVSIKYIDNNGKVKTYTPDVLVTYRKDIEPAIRMKTMLCEVKYRQDLKNNWAEYKCKFKAAVRYARNKGWVFRILTEREIRTPYLVNAKFLRRYRNMNVNGDDKKLLLHAIFEMREANPDEVLLFLSGDEQRRLEILPALWNLVSNRMIGTDLTLPLTMRSRLWSMYDVESVLKGRLP